VLLQVVKPEKWTNIGEPFYASYHSMSTAR